MAARGVDGGFFIRSYSKFFYYAVAATFIKKDFLYDNTYSSCKNLVSCAEMASDFDTLFDNLLLPCPYSFFP